MRVCTLSAFTMQASISSLPLQSNMYKHFVSVQSKLNITFDIKRLLKFKCLLFGSRMKQPQPQRRYTRAYEHNKILLLLLMMRVDGRAACALAHFGCVNSSLRYWFKCTPFHLPTSTHVNSHTYKFYLIQPTPLIISFVCHFAKSCGRARALSTR